MLACMLYLHVVVNWFTILPVVCCSSRWSASCHCAKVDRPCGGTARHWPWLDMYVWRTICRYVCQR